MFKCCDCGHLFEDGEQAVWYENQGECHGVTAMEKFSGCPLCQDDYEEVHQCKECGDWHTEDELYVGWCNDCLQKKLTPEIGLQYLIDSEDYLEHFAFLTFFGIDKVPPTSVELRLHLIDLVKRQATKGDFEQYIFFKESNKSDFAEWLSEREVK